MSLADLQTLLADNAFPVVACIALAIFIYIMWRRMGKSEDWIRETLVGLTNRVIAATTEVTHAVEASRSAAESARKELRELRRSQQQVVQVLRELRSRPSNASGNYYPHPSEVVDLDKPQDPPTTARTQGR